MGLEGFTVVSGRVTEEEKQAARLALARSEHQTMSRYVRALVLEDVRRRLGEKVLEEPAENGDQEPAQ